METVTENCLYVNEPIEFTALLLRIRPKHKTVQVALVPSKVTIPTSNHFYMGDIVLVEGASLSGGSMSVRENTALPPIKFLLLSICNS